MGVRFIYGRAGSGKSSYIFNEIASIINNEEKIYIITPEQFSYTAEKKLLEAVKSKAVVNAEVISFNRIAHRVRSEVGNNSAKSLEKFGKQMIIFDILDKNKKNLKLLGKSSKNIDIVSRLLTELKTHKVKKEELEEAYKTSKNEYLKTKIQDILKIYNEYEEKINKDFIDENDTLTILAKQLELTEMFKNSIIYIDEFVGFTPQEYAVMLKLFTKAKVVNITVCTDSLLESKNKDIDVFYTNKKTVSKIVKLANSNNVEILSPLYLKEQYRFKNEELKHLEKNIYNIPYKKYENEVKNISLFLAANPYSEIEYIAKEIIKMVRDNKLRYREISIITKNIESYSSLVKAVFSKYEIPVFIDDNKDLNDNILIKYIISILDVLSKNWDFDTVMEYAKNEFCDIEYQEFYEFENYCAKWGIKYTKWFKDFSYGNDEKAKFNEIRKKIVEPLLDLKENLIGGKTYESITKTIYDFLITNNIKEKLLEKSKEKENEEEIRNTYIASWNVLMKIFDEINLVFGNEKVSFDKYMQILKVAFNENSLGAIPATNDQVIIGDVDRSRSKKTRAVFIIGVNDGVFPSINKSEGFLNDEDRENLSINGIELAKTTKEQIYEEKFNIYKTFGVAEEKLYLSYVSSNLDGGALKPSTLIMRIKKIFPKLIQTSDIIKREDIITNKSASFEELLINLREFRDGKTINPVWFEIYNIYMEDVEWKDKLTRALKGTIYTNKPEDISKENIQNIYSDTLFTSVSRLEQYKKCPFSFYLKYELGISEKNSFEIQNIDTGNFMHDVIDTLFAKIRRKSN